MGFLNYIKRILGITCKPCENGNCQKLADLVPVILDGEATAEEKDFFKSHANGCKPCMSKYNIEQKLLKAVRDKLNRKCCPERLKNKIKKTIQSEDVG